MQCRANTAQLHTRTVNSVDALGELGATQVFDIPVDVTFESADKIHAVTTFNVSLDAFNVERPSLMMVKVDDALVMDADLTFKK